MTQDPIRPYYETYDDEKEHKDLEGNVTRHDSHFKEKIMDQKILKLNDLELTGAD